MLTGPRFREEHVLDDGTKVVLRHIHSEDAAELQHAFDHLSMGSRYQRFHGFVKELSPDMLRYLTSVDGRDHVAIVAVSVPDAAGHTEGLGVARFVRSREDSALAEVALTVVDGAQHKGLGRILGVAIARAAVERGIARFMGPILRDNLPIRALLDEVGAKLETTTDGLFFCVEIGTEPARLAPAVGRLLRAVHLSRRRQRSHDEADRCARETDRSKD